MTFPSRCLCLMVRGYQLTLSPLMGGQCRFYPSCSAYALEAIECYGAWSGALFAAKRVLRCHPWNPGGVDLVPHPGGPHPIGPNPNERD